MPNGVFMKNLATKSGKNVVDKRKQQSKHVEEEGINIQDVLNGVSGEDDDEVSADMFSDEEDEIPGQAVGASSKLQQMMQNEEEKDEDFVANDDVVIALPSVPEPEKVEEHEKKQKVYEDLVIPEMPIRKKGGRIPNPELEARNALNEAIIDAKKAVSDFETSDGEDRAPLYEFACNAVKRANDLLESLNGLMNGTMIQKVEEVKNEKQSDYVEENGIPEECVADFVLEYVCKQTIIHLMQTYSSKIYVKEYMEQLMQSYIDGKVDSSDPLFKQLIAECEEHAEPDPYLKDLTKIVLKWIKNN